MMMCGCVGGRGTRYAVCDKYDILDIMYYFEYCVMWFLMLHVMLFNTVIYVVDNLLIM